jgi:hypothetical protein
MSRPRRRFSALRPLPSGFDTSAHEPGAALEYEIAREKAASLGRLGRRLEAALEALSAFDAAHLRVRGPEREALVEEAGVLLWCFVVQREACGLRDSARVMQDYRVPAEVRAQMGISRRRPEDRRRKAENV